jgi:membrane protein
MRAKVRQFIATDIWRLRSRELPRKKRSWLRPLRMLVLSLKQFQEDKCALRASALTYYSLMSLVPILAMAFGISKGFGLEKALQKQLLTAFQGQEEVIAWVTGFATSLLETTRGGVMAGVGLLLLFWTIVSVLGNIEKSFNDIWGIKKHRSFPRKISDYLSAMVICPLLWIVSSAATVVIKTQITFVAQKISLVGTISPAIFFALRLLPYCVVWILFTFVYMFMPNTKVTFRSSVIGGIVAGTLYQLFQWAYLWSQIGVSKYNAIYGSFAALPLFLVWLQISWLIVLFGAELSFAHQNEEGYEFEPDCSKISYAFKKLLALRMTHLLVKHFSAGDRPLSPEQIANKLDMPIRLVRQIADELVESGVLSELCSAKTGGSTYQPARGLNFYRINYVIESMEQRGSDHIPVAESEELSRLSDCLKALGELVEKSPSNVLLKEI